MVIVIFFHMYTKFLYCENEYIMSQFCGKKVAKKRIKKKVYPIRVNKKKKDVLIDWSCYAGVP